MKLENVVRGVPLGLLTLPEIVSWSRHRCMTIGEMPPNSAMDRAVQRASLAVEQRLILAPCVLTGTISICRNPTSNRDGSVYEESSP